MHELVIVYIDNDKEKFCFQQNWKPILHTCCYTWSSSAKTFYLSLRACQATLNGVGGQRPNDTLPLPIEIQLPDNLKPLLSFVDI